MKWCWRIKALWTFKNEIALCHLWFKFRMIPESMFVIFICDLTVSVVLLQANVLGEMSFSESCVPVKTGCMFYKNLKYYSCLLSPNESQKISKYFCLLLVLVGCGTGILCFVRWDETRFSAQWDLCLHWPFLLWLIWKLWRIL